MKANSGEMRINVGNAWLASVAGRIGVKYQ